MIYSCEIESLGAPIINLENNKVIGLTIKDKITYDNVLVGSILKYALNDLNKIKNQIKITLEVKEWELYKNCYFLDNTVDYEDKDGIKKSHFNLREMSEYNVKLFINGIEHKYRKYFTPNKIGIYKIKLKFYETVKDCSFMFYNCDNIINIDLSSFQNNNITRMNSMFGKCSKLKYVDLNNVDTKKVIDMSNMFEECNNLKFVDLLGFRTENVKNMKKMFSGCSKFTSLNLTLFDTKNVTDMSGMFSGCSDLKCLDLTYFNTKNVTNMSNMFCCCRNLKCPDLTYFNTKNVNNMSGMFSGCNFSGIDLSSFDTKNVTNMSNMFMNCYNLKNINLSSFNTNKVQNVEFMFYWCKNLRNVDISSFNIDKINDKEQMFGLSSFDSLNRSVYKKLKIIKVNNNTFEEIKKIISSNSVKIIKV